MLVDRLAIMLVIAKSRYDDDWNPFVLSKTYDEPGSLGDEIRDWSSYKAARETINRWLKEIDK